MSANYNAAVDMVDRNVAEGRAAKTAFIDPARRISYGELADAVARVGPMLARLGLQREDRIAMIMLDTVDFPVLFWGAIRTGIIPIPLNTLLPVEQFRYILADSRAKALFVSPSFLKAAETAMAGLPTLQTLVVVGDGSAQYPSFGALLKDETPAAPAETCGDEVAFWLYSSGSTGMPKGVRHVHTSPRDTAKLYAQPVLGIRENDVCFSAGKLYHAYGLGNGMSFPMSVGATTALLPDRPTPAAIFEVLRREQPTLFFGAPTLYAMMLADPACTPENGSKRLRYCVSAAEALPEHVGTEWKKRFGIDILDGLGSSEMLHIFISNQAGKVRYGTSGTAVPGYDLRIVDDKGADVPDGELGELLVRGPTAAEGYWNQREKTRRTFEGEWTRTGDIYVRDPDGMYRYCGRNDDMFKVSGLWVSPFDVESALISHPSVLEAAVVAKEDSDGLLRPKAYVTLKDGAKGEEPLREALKEHVKQQIGMWKYPRWIDFVDSLPKTATGKIQRFKLRD
jgi:4-hydroxybenzoate-CoA ligase